MRIIACLLPGIFLTVFTNTTQAQSKKDLPPSNSWAVVPVTADGILNEWKTPLEYFDDKSHLAYEISNDSTNLYVAISTMDDATQVNIMRAGISLGVNIKGKKKINTAVTYPQIDGSVLFAQRRHNGNSAGGDNGDDNINGPSRQFRQRPGDVYSRLEPYMGKAGVKGITGLPDGTVDVTQHRTGIAAALYLGKDTLNVELVIPLAKLGLTPAYAKMVAYSITVNQDNQYGGSGNNNRGGTRGGGMGGLGFGIGVGGGMGGIGTGFGMNMGGFGGRRSMNGNERNKKSTIRIKQILAKDKVVP
ncbi:hypothetical protein SAMN05518672_103397 [Chitinophaga sp. CF118]|uniref:hypothetical protein n=1 Tax=Chitinophaga sp. CF118 TaxID=1884367 RepID=UPI0008E11F6A|nr:hypothetical protein [Chitinophaga sp. CF118]SFD82920.1 hypothetical protein SAMN05518672_103397 [Chitinophaga sp. CF118]